FRHNLLLIVKEVMHNVVKHAHATRLDVQLRLNTTELKLQMADNGCGFGNHESDPEGLRAPDHHRGSGLDNLRERAASLGGSCCIDSAPARGTTVTLILPFGVSKARSGRTKGP